MPLISVVVPCYNEEESLPLFARELEGVTCGMIDCDPDLSFELVLVDDGSQDATLEEMRRLAAESWRGFSVRWTSFSRNFGKEAGMLAGLRMARGDYVTTMDADMQDPPSLLPKMYAILRSDASYDCVATRRSTRAGEPPVRSFFSRMFYRIINRMSETEFVAVLSLGEYNRFSKGIFSWVGFETFWLEYENVERAAGTTKWNFWSLARYSVDGIVGFSTAPLALASVLGAVFSLIALVFAVVVVIRALCFGDPVAGWPSMMSVILLLGGLNLLVLGILGQYLGKTYMEVKARPLYVVRETSDAEEPAKSGPRESVEPKQP